MTPGARVRFHRDGRQVEGMVLGECWLCSARSPHLRIDLGDELLCVPVSRLLAARQYEAYQPRRESKPRHIDDWA